MRRTWRFRPSWIESSTVVGPSRTTRAGLVGPSSRRIPAASRASVALVGSPVTSAT
jgi:hypothetical protein